MTRYFVLPGGVDDPARPSGGNRYDRAVADRLADLCEIAVPGDWPRPSPAARTALSVAFSDIPDKSDVLIDGLVACGVPDIVAPAASRLRITVLVHLPLGDESDAAADLVPLERRTLHAAAAVVVTSSSARDRVIALHDLPRSKVHVAPPGVDPKPLASPSPGGERLLCVAAVTHRKGQDVLLRALSALDDLPWQCTCVGAGSLPDPGRVVFAGPRSGADLDAAYAGADLLILPSRAETYGMVVTEALSHGLPVIATQVSGVPEALGATPDGVVPGTLVPPADAGALSVALRAWLTDADLRTRWRTAAAARRQTLRSWDETTRHLREILQW